MIQRHVSACQLVSPIWNSNSNITDTTTNNFNLKTVKTSEVEEILVSFNVVCLNFAHKYQMQKCKHFNTINILAQKDIVNVWQLHTKRIILTWHTKFVWYNVMGRKDDHDCQDLSVQRMFHQISWPCHWIRIYSMGDTAKISSASNTTKTQIGQVVAY